MHMNSYVGKKRVYVAAIAQWFISIGCTTAMPTEMSSSPLAASSAPWFESELLILTVDNVASALRGGDVWLSSDGGPDSDSRAASIVVLDPLRATSAIRIFGVTQLVSVPEILGRTTRGRCLVRVGGELLEMCLLTGHMLPLLANRRSTELLEIAESHVVFLSPDENGQTCSLFFLSLLTGAAPRAIGPQGRLQRHIGTTPTSLWFLAESNVVIQMDRSGSICKELAFEDLGERVRFCLSPDGQLLAIESRDRGSGSCAWLLRVVRVEDGTELYRGTHSYSGYVITVDSVDYDYCGYVQPESMYLSWESSTRLRLFPPTTSKVLDFKADGRSSFREVSDAEILQEREAADVRGPSSISSFFRIQGDELVLLTSGEIFQPGQSCFSPEGVSPSGRWALGERCGITPPQHTSVLIMDGKTTTCVELLGLTLFDSAWLPAAD